jgi:hypothetical protein
LATTGWSGGKATGETERAKTNKNKKSWKEKLDDSADRQKKRQRGGSGVAKTQMATQLLSTKPLSFGLVDIFF